MNDAPGERAPATEEAIPEDGWVTPALRAEFPTLRLRHATVAAQPGRSPRHVRERLRELSNRRGGSWAVNLRGDPIPAAYRAFFHHIGLDPDDQPTPLEEIALERMKRGRFRPTNTLDDALVIAAVETGVPLRAFDADRVEGRVGLRPSEPGEALEGRPVELPAGTLVVADERRPLGVLFGETAERRGVGPGASRILLTALQLENVPEMAIEESFWIAASVLRSS